MGTGYRSAFDMDQNQTRLIIDTDEHPGFYIISLIQNGTILTTRYINAGNIYFFGYGNGRVVTIRGFIWRLLRSYAIIAVAYYFYAGQSEIVI